MVNLTDDQVALRIEELLRVNNFYGKSSFTPVPMNPKFDPNLLAMKVGQLSEGVTVSLQRIKGAIEECKGSNFKRSILFTFSICLPLRQVDI